MKWRLRARPIGSSLGATGTLELKPTAVSRAGATPESMNRRTTLLARTAELKPKQREALTTHRADALQSREFWRATRITVVFTIASVFLETLLGQFGIGGRS